MTYGIRLLLVVCLLLHLMGRSHACDGLSSTYGSFQGVDHVELQFISIDTADQSKGALVIVPGAKVQFLQYCELVNDMKDLGFAIYMMDHRGQGRSDRLIDDPMPHYIDDFSYYVDDLKTFVDTFVKPNHDRLFAWADSMGAGILTSYCEEYQDDFSAIVLSNPMHQIQACIPVPLTYSITSVGVLFFAGACYGLGQGPYDANLDTFEANKSTSDPVRFATNKEIFGRTAMGGATNNWVSQTICALNKVRCKADKLLVPTLILQAELDAVVENSAQNEVCDKAPSCSLVVMTGSKHAIWNEADAIRNVALYDHTIPFFLVNQAQ